MSSLYVTGKTSPAQNAPPAGVSFVMTAVSSGMALWPTVALPMAKVAAATCWVPLSVSTSNAGMLTSGRRVGRTA